MAVSTRPAVVQPVDASGRTPARRRVPSPRLAPVVGALIAVFAVESLVVVTDGALDASVRALRLAVICALAGCLWWAWTRAGGRLRALLEIAVGVGGLIAAGIATLARAGDLPLLHPVLAVPVALGSLALIAVGGVRFVRSIRPGWRRVVAVPVLVVATLYLATPIAMGVLVTNRARPVLGERTPADMGLSYEDVTLLAPGGAQLLGWYVPSTNGAAVLALPGSGSTRDDVLDHAAMLAEGGYGVLLVDVPGHGGSSGEPMELGWGGEDYLRPALDHLATRSDVGGPIGVVGLSMGGEQAITLAAADPRIAAVVADGASGRTWEDAWDRPDPIVARSLMLPFNLLNTTATDLLADASPPMPLVDAVGAMGTRPLLLISTGTGVEREANRVLVEAGANAELWELPDAAHIAGIHADPAGYERRVLAFLDAALEHPHDEA